MTEGDPNVVPGPQLANAGEWLRMAREQAGLSIDAVAQQLKLHPRQVQALEDGAFDALPGRTFVRGFIRNYARLLHLDPEAVVAALPGTDAAPALEGPAIGSTSRPMGELPPPHAARGPSWSRWAIPVALVAAVAVAAFYEFMRPQGGTPEPAPLVSPLPVEPAPGGGTPLPNPVAGDAAAPSAPPSSAPAPAESASATSAPPTPAAETPTSAAAATPAAPPAAATGDATLVIRYAANAWTQVRDATGQTILITNGQPGGTQTVHGKPPFDLVLGNAEMATITWRGQPFDLGPHTKGNVARVRLP